MLFGSVCYVLFSGKAEIVSVDAFTKNENSEVPTLVLGVTFIDNTYKFSIFTAPLKGGTPFFNTLQIATGNDTSPVKSGLYWSFEFRLRIFHGLFT